MLQLVLAALGGVGGAIVITTFLLWALSGALSRLQGWLLRPPHSVKTVLSMIFVSVWLLIGMILALLPWAWVFVWVGALPDFETALYFSAVTYTTVGYGDVTLPPGTRLLGTLCAGNGLLMFGLYTAFLIEFLRRLRVAQHAVDGGEAEAPPGS